MSHAVIHLEVGRGVLTAPRKNWFAHHFAPNSTLDIFECARRGEDTAPNLFELLPNRMPLSSRMTSRSPAIARAYIPPKSLTAPVF